MYGAYYNSAPLTIFAYFFVFFGLKKTQICKKHHETKIFRYFIQIKYNIIVYACQ